jgi:hypothetical protein
MSKALNAVLIVGLLIIAALTGYGLISVLRGAVQPAAQAGGQVATTVALILPPTPTPRPDGEAVVLAMKSVARLETAQFTIEKVIIKEQGQGALGALFGDHVIFVAHGDVIGGVDLSKLVQGDVAVLPNGKAFVTLPAAEIFVTTIDNDKSYVVDRQTGLLTKGNINLETEARQEAQHEIENAALEAGILDQAQKNAETYLRQLMSALGYPDVTFVRATAVP